MFTNLQPRLPDSDPGGWLPRLTARHLKTNTVLVHIFSIIEVMKDLTLDMDTKQDAVPGVWLYSDRRPRRDAATLRARRHVVLPSGS
jgi:hypothetical protein